MHCGKIVRTKKYSTAAINVILYYTI